MILIATFTGDCDFEDDICTWTNAQAGDDFDWIRRDGGRAGNGGPPNDHTTGTRDGKLKIKSPFYTCVLTLSKQEVLYVYF